MLYYETVLKINTNTTELLLFKFLCSAVRTRKCYRISTIEGTTVANALHDVRTFCTIPQYTIVLVYTMLLYSSQCIELVLQDVTFSAVRNHASTT